MERMKIIILFNYVVGRDFLGLVMSIEQSKFQSKFKENNFASQKVRKLIFFKKI
jgi:hypothetical protein